MVYRNDVDALEARHQALESELADRVRERDDVARLLAEAKAREAAERIRSEAACVAPARSLWRLTAICVTALLAIVGVTTMRMRHDRGWYRFAEVASRFEAYADRICQCPDNTCAQHVMSEMADWAARVGREQRPSDLIDDGSQRRLERAAERLTHCMTAAATNAMNATAEAPGH